MKVSEKERRRISRFVFGQLRDEPDLNTLTLGILKRQYLAHVQCESLSPAAKAFMKQVVEEELIKMEEGHDQDGSDLKTRKTQNKRKRDEENDEVLSEGEDESTAKKSRCQSSSSSSESEDIEDSKTGSKEDEQIKSGAQTEEKQMTKSQKKKKGNWIKSDESSDEKVNDSEAERGENNGSSSEEEVKKENNIGEQNKKSPGQKLPQSDEDSDADNKSERSNKVENSDSSDDNGKEENGMMEKQNNNSDSDSSSLPSLEEESGTGTKKTQEKEPSTKKKNTTKKKESTEGQRDDNKAIVRLKRYITLCGVRRNYKKLFEGCKSIRAKVAALKKELEDLGVHGNPTIEKCKKVRMKREEDEELADLDVSNIIATQGRPKRRGAQQEHFEPPSMTYQRALNSCSDSDEESTAQRAPRRTTHWANLQGIISDDADSN